MQSNKTTRTLVVKPTPSAKIPEGFHALEKALEKTPLFKKLSQISDMLHVSAKAVETTHLQQVLLSLGDEIDQAQDMVVELLLDQDITAKA